MAIAVEYLALFTKSTTVCDSTEGFLHLLHVDSRLRVENGTLKYEGVAACKFSCEQGVVPDRDQRHFRLTFTFDGNTEDAQAMSRFRSALRAVRSAMHGKGDLQLVWDEVSAHYAAKAYPTIHELENLMRRLIASLMLGRIGRKWADEVLPRALSDALQRTKKAESHDYLNVLHKLDFCQLGDFLFLPYSPHTTDALYKAVRELKPGDDGSSLQGFVPRSNWDRYFGTLVTCDDGYLRKRWADLYELRCRVAHNTEFTGDHLATLETLAGEVRPHLIAAIQKVAEVNIPAAESEAIAESVVRGVNETVGEFIVKWQALESAVMSFAAGATTLRIPSGGELHRRGILTKAQAKDYEDIRAVRNSVVHGSGATIDRDALHRYLEPIDSLIDALEDPTPVAELARMEDSERKTWLQEHIDQHQHRLIDSDAVSSRIAETNASEFTVDEVDVDDVALDLDEDQCVAHFTFSAAGEQLEERMYSGTRIKGSGEAVFGPGDEVDFRDLYAEIDNDNDDDDDQE